MKISANFSDKEFFDPEVYSELVRTDRDPRWYIDRLLVEELEALRKWLNKIYAKAYQRVIVEITETKSGRNGFETAAGLKKRGSSRWGQHGFGRAVDLNAYGVKGNTRQKIPPREVQKFFKNSYNYGGLGRSLDFTHRDVRWSDKLIEWDYKEV